MKFKVGTSTVSKHSIFDNFASWSKSKKIPEPTQICGNGSKPWVTWGADNCYPLFLNTLYEESPSQGGIINGKCYYITAGGYTITLRNPNDNAQKLLVQEFEANGPSQFTMTEVIYDQVFDAEMYNGFAIRGVWNENGTRPKFLEQIDFDCIRTDENETKYWYSNDWSKSTQSFLKTGFREIPRLDFSKKAGEFILYIRRRGKRTKKNQSNTYPKPPYTGCIKALMTEVEHEQYDLYEVLNGFKTGTAINFPNPDFESDEEREEFVNDVKEGSTDSDATNGILVTFSEGGGNDAPTVLNLNGNNLPERYINVSKKTGNTIIRGHSIVTPGLFGIVIEGQLGAQTELEAGFEIFKKTYVSGRQRWYNTIYDWVAKNLYGIEGDFVLNPPPPLFGGAEQEDPKGKAINQLSPLVATKVLNVMTPNEIRSLGKLPAIPGGDEIPTPGNVVMNITQKDGKPDEKFCNCEAHDDQFLARDPVLKEFAKVGRKRSGFIFAKSSPVPVECTGEWFDGTEKDLMESLKTEKLFFATLLNELQKNVLALIDAGEDSLNISKALTNSMGRVISIQEVMDAYNQLSGKGLVKKDGRLSEAGKKYLNVTEAPIDKFEILYSYELRPDAPRLIGESRSFCKELLRMDKLYTRAEIDAISAAVDRNVWNYKGGWYHDPETNQNKPYCRHYWLQHLALKNAA